MAPAVTLSAKSESTLASDLDKVKLKDDQTEKVFNPFYSPSISDDGDNTYEFSKYKPSFPKVSWEPLGPIEVSDRGHHANAEKKSLLSAATKVRHYNGVIGTELSGIDLAKLTDAQKDELALLVAERGVVFIRGQKDFTIEQQLDLARHYGPLHKHATTPVPRQPGLEEVHVVYNDASKRPDPSAYSSAELWHSDVTYELQPPSTTSLKVLAGPEFGGDTLWTSGYGVYSSLSPAFQQYLETLSAVHSAVAQADGARAAGLPVRREPIETVHPIVRVHPVTGWKSVFVNPGFTRRIIGIPKAESDAVLAFLFRTISSTPHLQAKFSWVPGDIAFWDNRVTTHSATFDFYPHRRHALRATPHGEKPLSVADYEKTTGKRALDREEALGIKYEAVPDTGINKPRGYND